MENTKVICTQYFLLKTCIYYKEKREKEREREGERQITARRKLPSGGRLESHPVIELPPAPPVDHEIAQSGCSISYKDSWILAKIRVSWIENNNYIDEAAVREPTDSYLRSTSLSLSLFFHLSFPLKKSLYLTILYIPISKSYH